MNSGRGDAEMAELDDGDCAEQQDKNIWMKDGNVILSAGEKPVVLFKCHKSVLRRHSEFFDEMLGIPNAPTCATDLYQGLPRIPLTDDVNDVRALLEMLYDPLQISFAVCENGTAEKIAGPLRLARKYMMHGLFHQLVAVLERDWPSSYQEWEINRKITMTKMDQNLNSALQNPSVNEVDYTGIYSNPSLAVSLARELDLSSVYPIAMYEVYRWYPVPAAEMFDSDVYLPVDDSVFTSEDLRRLLIGKQSLSDAVMELITMISDEHGHCRSQRVGVNADLCSQGKTAWMGAAFRDICNHRGGMYAEQRDYIWKMRRIRKELASRTGAHQAAAVNICLDCHPKLVQRIARGQQQLWDQLPEIFNL